MSTPTLTVRRAVYTRDEYRCASCRNVDGLTFQHRRATGMGGTKSLPRYEKSGKWYREEGHSRRPVKLAAAALYAVDERPAVIWHEGTPGGRIFDAKVRTLRAARIREQGS